MRTQFKFTESFNIPTFDTPTYDKAAVAALAEKVVAANERVLDVVVDANRRLADAAVTSADRAAEALPVALPFAGKLPTPAESAASYLDFVERAAAVNREFNQRVLTRLTVDAPVDTVVGTDTQSVATPTAKKATKKATAKKVAAKRTTTKKSAAKKSAATSSAAAS